MLGATVDLLSLDGMVELKIPAGSQPASRLVMRNKGAQRVNGPASSRGNLYVHLKLEVPRNITDRQRELMEEFAQEEVSVQKAEARMPLMRFSANQSSSCAFVLMRL